MDGISRENAQMGLDEKVKICKIDHKPANKITLSPLTVSSLLQRDKDTRYIGSLIEGLPVIAVKGWAHFLGQGPAILRYWIPSPMV